MAISTDSIIHYTDDIEKLKGIISEGFKIKYCVEVLYTNDEQTSNAHPMISFCDIPLSESNRHFGLYGCYGIGMSKEWAKKMRINPVLYIEKESYIGASIKNSFTATATDPEIKELIIQTKCFTKNYSGRLKRGSIDSDNYIFYDEREWRFIPQKKDIGNKSRSLNISDYTKNKAKFNQNLADYRFKFEISDISYLIVKNTSEIPEIIEFLRNTFYKTIIGSELDILLSKVCSTEQIIRDY